MSLKWLLFSIVALVSIPTLFVDGKPAVSGIKFPFYRNLPKFPSHRFPNSMPAPGFTAQKNLATQKQGRNLCGPDHGPCERGFCCSLHGYCGHGPDYCQAPDCLFDFGSGCDALKWPQGADTSTVPRPHVGEIPYSFVPIYQCVVPNTIALTFDDGPNIYTADLLDILDSYDAKATFFVSAFNSNKGSIDDPNYPWADLIHRMFNSGHQIASHTWSHQNLDSMSNGFRREQMIKTEMVLRNILGGFPTYMRPPYSACSVQSGCLGDMDDLGYHVAYFNVDTDDYNNASPHQIQRSKDLFDHSMAMHEVTGRPMLVIAHDVHEQTVYNLTIHMLHRLYESNYRPVTLGECLGDPPTNWYRWTEGSLYYPELSNSNASYRRPGEKPVSNDGTCGKDYTCAGSKFGKCCSAHGFCGNATEHCGSGCQESAGVCSFQVGNVILSNDSFAIPEEHSGDASHGGDHDETEGERIDGTFSDDSIQENEEDHGHEDEEEEEEEEEYEEDYDG